MNGNDIADPIGPVWLGPDANFKYAWLRAVRTEHDRRAVLVRRKSPIFPKVIGNETSFHNVL